MGERAQSGLRAVVDIVVYSLLRLGLVAALTVLIYGVARLIGVDDLPLVVALGFAFIIGLPLGIWLFGAQRRRATADLAALGERRRRDREQLHARLRGEGAAENATDAAAEADADAPEADRSS
ncbi:DUF4229 domain-containing protein [Mycolicibacillus parakoreensis]|uniref:DUF4229 domain-containing protein n=1 Tax=Mycolicibacillus parakoreensis TaxID=1069221 RepID=A0ABY3U4H4_9MYCO|nr:DUF4229 domain-containing protein [Mycolicibacillus parakoreensis]MCV7316065.1 DUF4229 domain-containing protein [Mycolicibacillus parakoreensis]ULN52314.1 DUF4229 domain-containing protein [Mycolicibacillus parakoreensis]